MGLFFLIGALFFPMLLIQIKLFHFSSQLSSVDRLARLASAARKCSSLLTALALSVNQIPAFSG